MLSINGLDQRLNASKVIIYKHYLYLIHYHVEKTVLAYVLVILNAMKNKCIRILILVHMQKHEIPIYWILVCSSLSCYGHVR